MEKKRPETEIEESLLKKTQSPEFEVKEKSHESESELEDRSDDKEVRFGVFRPDESGYLVKIDSGETKEQPSTSKQLPERGWGKSFLQHQSSAFGSFYENPNPFLFPGSMLSRPSPLPSFTRGGLTPAGPALPSQEALFNSIKMKEKVSP